MALCKYMPGSFADCQPGSQASFASIKAATGCLIASCDAEYESCSDHPSGNCILGNYMLDDSVQAETLLRLLEENRLLRLRLSAARRTMGSLRVALEQCRREAMTDPLTRLYNRRAMDQCLDEIWATPEAGRLAGG